ncbi:hypothetical protein LSH36_831g00015 [Paralvinella palmiformis]|uniref:C2 domain-containing protein n=1 Tax=Paralvinella palmiformis TaxID=53620 RepID=A0AAD9J027_9ANNE|nr:hypothetical protein LSH36_831g00015 [Paralvinella palmiformis]
MLCGRGRKRKSVDFDQDQENLLRMDNGDYVCMQRRDSRHKRPLLVRAPLPRHHAAARCYDNEDYEVCPQRHRKPRGFLKSRGQLHLSIYVNCGLLTVHVIEASQLSVGQTGEPRSSYVKIRLSPDHSKRSSELLDEDLRKRILISVWNKQKNDEHSEFLGCMSYGIQPILSHKKTVNGWYYLLTEDLGKRKHLQVTARSSQPSPTRLPMGQDTKHQPSRPIQYPWCPEERVSVQQAHHDHPGFRKRSDVHRQCSPIRGTLCKDDSLVPRSVMSYQYDISDTHDLISPVSGVRYSFDSPHCASPRRENDDFLHCSPITPNMSPIHNEANIVPNNRSHMYTNQHQERTRHLGASCCSPAESVGLQKDDLIVHLNGKDVVKANAETVAKIIKMMRRRAAPSTVRFRTIDGSTKWSLPDHTSWRQSSL